MPASVDSISTERGRVSVAPSEGFVVTRAVARVAERALTYLRAGYPVHLCGPTGTGKTTLGFHVAAQLGRPIVLLHGDHQLTSADLVGSPSGTRTSRVVDNYVRSVVRMEEEKRELWVDNRLTTACRYGHTLIYDEFNRTTAEANNPLLSVFSEGILNLPKASDGRESYIRVHPGFTAVLTSNPEEYAGVFRAPDALLDRVVTIHLDYYDADTEAAIVAARARIEPDVAERIVRMVRALRAANLPKTRATVRAAITIGKILASSHLRPSADDALFREVCVDVLGADPFSLPGFSTLATTPGGVVASAPGVRVDAGLGTAGRNTEPGQAERAGGAEAASAPDHRDEGSLRAGTPDEQIQTAAADGSEAQPECDPLGVRNPGVRLAPRRGRKKAQPPMVDWLHALDDSEPERS
jgi:gas vesicle protein GvpN